MSKTPAHGKENEGHRKLRSAHPTSGFGVAMAVLLLLTFCAVASSVVGELWRGIIVGAMAFLVYRYIIVREFICRHQRRGILLTRDGHWAKALVAFEKSETFWTWFGPLDRCRGIALGSTSRWPFVAMARANQVSCLSQLDRIDDAVERCERLLVQYPDMKPAEHLLNGLKTMKSAEPSDGLHHAAPEGLLGEDDQSAGAP